MRGAMRPLSITSSASLMILMTAVKLLLPPMRSPGCAASSSPGGRWSCSTTAATKSPRSANWLAGSTTSCSSGLRLKLMARHVGFRWRDDDPGGLNSQLWFAEAVHGETPEARVGARRRVLEYNEDDVIATSQVRAWLRAQ